MREPVLGDFDNGRDDVVVKNIDILADDLETVDNTIVATEWFAELCFAGFWRVNPDWLAAWLEAQEPDEPEPEDPPAEPEPVDPPPAEEIK